MTELSQQMLSHLPRIELAPSGQQRRLGRRPRPESETKDEEIKKRQSAVLRYVLRLEGDQGGTVSAGAGGGAAAYAGMPSEVFYELLKMMGPSYYPVKEGAGSDGKV